jgi:drug/metabolite transporter (DMT)-like permease
MHSPAPGRARVVAGFLAIYLLWGSTYLAIRFAVETLPPFLMASARWIVPGLLMVAWARWRERVPAPTPAQLRATAIVGVLLLVGGNGLVSWAEQWVPSGIAALVIASIPLWMAALEWGRARRQGLPHRLDARTLTGILAGFAGVAVLVRASPAVGTSEALGMAALVLAALLWAIGSLVARHADLPRSAIFGTGLEMLWGGGALLLLGTVTGEWGRLDLASVSARSVWALVYLTVFGSILGFSAYVWLLRVSTPAKVSTYAYVNPLVAVFLGWGLGGEPITTRVLVAAALVIGSVVMITSSRS